MKKPWGRGSIYNNSFDLIKIQFCFIAKKCENYFEARGCFHDVDPKRPFDQRPLQHYLLNERDPYAENWNRILIDWTNWGTSYLPGLLCRCSHAAKKQGFKYFGIQFYGE